MEVQTKVKHRFVLLCPSGHSSLHPAVRYVLSRNAGGVKCRDAGDLWAKNEP
jgi:hypothetical protein